MSKIIIPENYTPALNLYDTQRGRVVFRDDDLAHR